MRKLKRCAELLGCMERMSKRVYMSVVEGTMKKGNPRRWM